MLTISRLSRWSIAYYEKTANEAKQAAMDRQAAGGGLGEYYSEGDTRVPTWIVTGDAARVAELTGLGGAALASGFADGDVVTAWLDDGIAPNRATGRAFTKGSVHGFDLTFAAPKSVSLVRALTSDVTEKVIAEAHIRAVNAAVDYLHRPRRIHPGAQPGRPGKRTCSGCRVWWRSPTSTKPRGAGIRTCTPTSSCPTGKPAPTARWFRSTPSRCTTKPRPPGSSIRPSCVTSCMPSGALSGWRSASAPGWPRSPGSPTSASKRGRGAPHGCGNGRGTTWSSSTASRPPSSSRPRRKPRGQPSRNRKSWAELKEEWRADARGLELDRAAHTAVAARAPRRAAHPGSTARALARMVARIDKSAFTRADLVELVGALLPVDAPGDPRALIEQIVDAVSLRVTAPREAHHREGHELFTVDAVIAEEQRIFDMIDAADTGTRLDVRAADLGDLSADQARAIGNIAQSPYLVQPLQAPAGAGKTHSLESAARRRAPRQQRSAGARADRKGRR